MGFLFWGFLGKIRVGKFVENYMRFGGFEIRRRGIWGYVGGVEE